MFKFTYSGFMIIIIEIDLIDSKGLPKTNLLISSEYINLAYVFSKIQKIYCQNIETMICV